MVFEVAEAALLDQGALPQRTQLVLRSKEFALDPCLTASRRPSPGRKGLSTLPEPGRPPSTSTQVGPAPRSCGHGLEAGGSSPGPTERSPMRLSMACRFASAGLVAVSRNPWKERFRRVRWGPPNSSSPPTAPVELSRESGHAVEVWHGGGLSLRLLVGLYLVEILQPRRTSPTGFCTFFVELTGRGRESLHKPLDSVLASMASRYQDAAQPLFRTLLLPAAGITSSPRRRATRWRSTSTGFVTAR